MKFNFNKIAYTSDFEYKKHTLVAILDTGATNSTMDIASLAKLLDNDPQVIYDYANNHINRFKVYESVATASGKKDRTIGVMLHNIELAEHHFGEFYFRLNVDNESWKDDDSGKYALNSSILIGLDIIRNGEIHGDKDCIEIRKFNMEKYIARMKQRYSGDRRNILTLYTAMGD